MKLIVSGICGHMGQEVLALADAGYHGIRVVAGVDRSERAAGEIPVFRSFDALDVVADCIVDFSHRSLTAELLRFAVLRKLPLVLATTGQNDGERAAIVRAAEQIPLFFAANCSLGTALLLQFAKQAAKALPDAEIEIVEVHHDRKADAPSGTALALAEELCRVRSDASLRYGRCGSGKREKGEIGIHSLRMGNVVGEHTVFLCTPTQCLTLKHEAYARSLFAEGAVLAAEFLSGQKNGLYGMADMVTF